MKRIYLSLLSVFLSTPLFAVDYPEAIEEYFTKCNAILNSTKERAENNLKIFALTQECPQKDKEESAKKHNLSIDDLNYMIGFQNIFHTPLWKTEIDITNQLITDLKSIMNKSTRFQNKLFFKELNLLRLNLNEHYEILKQQSKLVIKQGSKLDSSDLKGLTPARKQIATTMTNGAIHGFKELLEDLFTLRHYTNFALAMGDVKCILKSSQNTYLCVGQFHIDEKHINMEKIGKTISEADFGYHAQPAKIINSFYQSVYGKNLIPEGNTEPNNNNNKN